MELKIICFLFVINVITICGKLVINPSDRYKIEIKPIEEESLTLSAFKDGIIKQTIILGKNIGIKYNPSFVDGINIFDFTDKDIRLEITTNTSNDDLRIHIKWISPKNARLEDCIDLGSYQWYGGPQQKQQLWPIQKSIIKDFSIVTKAYSGINEPYWLNSEGTLIYVNKEVPLFVDQNNILKNNLCLISEIKEPYSNRRSNNELSYDIVITKDPKSGHEYAVNNYLGKPRNIPDVKMIDRPIFTTWPRYTETFNQSVIINFVNDLKKNGFNNGIIEMDDYWETCPGSLIVDPKKYPDFKQMIQDIKSNGFNFTLWIHPFIYYFCNPWSTEAKDKGYVVKSEDGKILTSISKSEIMESHIDFTNSEAKQWWINRVKDLQNNYDLDGFKYCAGESMYTIQIAVQNGDIRLQPSLITSEYLRTASIINGNNIVRPGQRTQDLPIFTYMGDKDFTWSFDNGLPTVITTLLQNNMNGYPFIIANMITGDLSYSQNKELYIRWIAACTFIPNLQIPYPPWNFDDETVQIVHKFLNLHNEHKSSIETAMKKSVSHGTPVNGPIWWIDPTDEQALQIWDEYLLGEDILVAPILEKGATSRDIYLPAGKWRYGRSDITYNGKDWIRNFSADLNTLPYFIKI